MVVVLLGSGGGGRGLGGGRLSMPGDITTRVSNPPPPRGSGGCTLRAPEPSTEPSHTAVATGRRNGLLHRREVFCCGSWIDWAKVMGTARAITTPTPHTFQDSSIMNYKAAKEFYGTGTLVPRTQAEQLCVPSDGQRNFATADF